MNREEFIQKILEDRLKDQRENLEGIVRVPEGEYQYLFATNSLNQGFFLMWDENELGSVTRENYTLIYEEANRAEVELPYQVYARFELLHSKTVKFHKLNPQTGEVERYPYW